MRMGNAERAPPAHAASIARRRRSRSSACTATSQSHPRTVTGRPVTSAKRSLARTMPSAAVPRKIPGTTRQRGDVEIGDLVERVP